MKYAIFGYSSTVHRTKYVSGITHDQIENLRASVKLD